MGKIITITFNPALDKSTTAPQVYPESKIRCELPKFEPGGGGINVSRALKKLGQDSICIYTKGGPIGDIFETLIGEEELQQYPIPVKNWTRENFIIVEESTNNQFRFGMPGASLSEDEINAVFQQLEAIDDIDYIIASGSLPPGTPDDTYARLADIAAKKEAKYVVDCSGEPLKKALDKGVFLAKPNQKEIGKLTGLDPDNLHELELAAQQLIKEGKATYLMVSLGAAGAFLASEDSIFRVHPPRIHKKTTVGAGDSMVAGLVYALFNNFDMHKAAMYGVATGSAATMNTGTELCKKEDVENLFQYITDHQSVK